MLQRMYEGIGQEVFRVDHQPQPTVYIDNLEAFNETEGLVLSADKIT